MYINNMQLKYASRICICNQGSFHESSMNQSEQTNHSSLDLLVGKLPHKLSRLLVIAFRIL